MKTGIYLFFVLAAISISCQDEKVFESSPSERSAEHISNLRKELTEAPYGWRVIYFSKTDSLLFSNPNELISQYGYREHYGYGGHCFLMKFLPEGIVEMTADYDEHTIEQIKRSRFEVRQNTFTCLSFTTYNYLHDIVNDRFSGSSDFLYFGKDSDGNLVFKTSSYFEPAKEYIVFQKLERERDRADYIKKSYENRVFFEKMKNPQLIIRKEDRIYFKSDMFLKREDELNTPWLNKIKSKRYYLFLYAKVPNLIGWPREVNGLGSGYVGTEHGLSFRTGFRYNKNYIFYDFQRVGNRFVCELVRVYDPVARIERWVSRHLAPQGETTGVVAEIWDNMVER